MNSDPITIKPRVWTVFAAWFLAALLGEIAILAAVVTARLGILLVMKVQGAGDAEVHAGGEAPMLVQRKDDREDVIENRLRVYERETRPLVDHYRDRGLLRVVKADGPVERVSAEFLRSAGGG